MSGSTADYHGVRAVACRHQFVLQPLTVPKPTYCDYCKQLLWIWQGRFRYCTLCEMRLHEPCYQTMVANLHRAAKSGDGDAPATSPHGSRTAEHHGLPPDPPADTGASLVSSSPGARSSPFDVVTHEDATEAAVSSLYFVHRHELAPKRFVVPFHMECIVCGLYFKPAEEGYECLSCDDCYVHVGCVKAALEREAKDTTTNGGKSSSSSSGSTTAEAPSGSEAAEVVQGATARAALGEFVVLSERDVAYRNHDPSRSSIISETLVLAHLLSRRNKRWQLALLNPTAAPALAARHAHMYKTICNQLEARSAAGRHGEVLQPAEWAHLAEALRFATAVYGVAYKEGPMTSVLGCVLMRAFNRNYLTPKDETNTQAVAEILALPREAVKLASWSYVALEPSYCLVVDHHAKKLVLMFRGSLSDADFLSDVCAGPREFCSGHAHSGMAEMTERLFDPACPLLTVMREHWTRNPGYRCLVTGHSLGGGLTQLFMVRLLRTMPQWMTQLREAAGNPPLQEFISAVAFAPPPVLTLPCAGEFDDTITCVVGGNDAVCRMQLNAIDRLANEFTTSAALSLNSPSHESTASPPLDAQLISEMSEELHLVGRIWLLTRPTSRRRNHAALVPRGHAVLHQIFVSSSALSNHLMDHYAAGLKSVKPTAPPCGPQPNAATLATGEVALFGVAVHHNKTPELSHPSGETTNELQNEMAASAT